MRGGRVGEQVGNSHHSPDPCMSYHCSCLFHSTAAPTIKHHTHVQLGSYQNKYIYYLIAHSVWSLCMWDFFWKKDFLSGLRGEKQMTICRENGKQLIKIHSGWLYVLHTDLAINVVAKKLYSQSDTLNSVITFSWESLPDACWMKGRLSDADPPSHKRPSND